MIDALLLPENTTITAKGDGSAVPIGSAASCTLLVTLHIRKVVEQESLELSIFGSADGQTWSGQPLLRFPQRFYCGETPMLLEIDKNPEIKYLRAHWEVNRWGRGPEIAVFEITVAMKQVPKEMLAQTS